MKSKNFTDFKENELLNEEWRQNQSSSYLFIYQVTSYHTKKLQLPLGLLAKHRYMQFLQNQHTNLQSQSDI